MSTSWAIKEVPASLETLSEQIHLTPIILKTLWSRGFETPETIEHFLHADTARLLDPFLLPGTEEAARRIFEAVKQNELIMLHGDYDVDGVTASAVMARALTTLGASFITYIPHRKDGYGFNSKGVEYAREKKVRLILTLDCGITSREEIEEASRHGIDTVIVDHHQIPAEGAPRAAAVINPWLDRVTGEPFLELSAAGLAFKLASALVGEEAYRWLDMAAVGTVADVAPLAGENRIIVKAGLKALAARTHIGFSALLKSAAFKSRTLVSRDIGFVIGPRLNAGGRMDTAEDALRILMTTEAAEATELARLLEERNQSRRKVEQEMLKEAIEQCEREVNFKRDRVIVVWSERFHPGVIGIVAARLVDRYYRPAMVISLMDKKGKGSARSIRHFNVHHALTAVSRELNEFGGHEYAAGFGIDVDRLSSFRKAVNDYAETVLKPEHLLRPVDIDAEILLSDITAPLINELSMMAPFGAGNPEPLFLTRNVRLKEKPKVAGKWSTYLWITDGKKIFRASAKDDAVSAMSGGEVFDLVYAIRTDTWQGQETVTLHVKDVKWSEKK